MIASITAAGRSVVETATDGLNTAVFARPGLDPARVAALTELLGAVRSDAGDLVDG